MSHSHSGGNPDPHVIIQGANWDKMLGAAYSPTNWIDTATWTATYVVFPHGDSSQAPAIALGTSGGMLIEYDDGADSTTTTAGITLGIQGEDLATTTLSGTAAEGASTVTVTSATGFAVGQVIVIELDDGSVQVDTITDVAGTTITLASTLVDPATSGNDVTVYDPDWALANIYLHLSKTATAALTDWGVGRYRFDLIDPFGHVQLTRSGTCCLDRGYGHG